MLKNFNKLKDIQTETIQVDKIEFQVNYVTKVSNRLKGLTKLSYSLDKRQYQLVPIRELAVGTQAEVGKFNSKNLLILEIELF